MTDIPKELDRYYSAVERIEAKEKEMEQLYEELSGKEKLLDFLMMQIAKEIEGKFPGIEFQLVSRVKSKESFENKRYNDLHYDIEPGQIKDYMIYDVIALSIIIDNVPFNLESTISKLNDDLPEIVQKRRKMHEKLCEKQTKLDGKVLELKRLGEEKQENDELITKKQELVVTKEARLASRIQVIEEKREQISEIQIELSEVDKSKGTDISKENELLSKVRAVLHQQIQIFERDIQLMEAENNDDLKELEAINSEIERLKKLKPQKEARIRGLNGELSKLRMEIGNIKLELEDEKAKTDCARAMAKYIMVKLPEFESMRALGVTSIPGRFKEGEKTAKNNGFFAHRNSYRMPKENKMETYVFEIQGKSAVDYENAERGRAADYHNKPKKSESGKIPKNKNLPDMEQIRSIQEQLELENDDEKRAELLEKLAHEKAEFIKKVSRKIPTYRVYRNTIKRDDNGNIIEICDRNIYKLSFKECFMLFFENQLFGNPILEIVEQSDVLDLVGKEMKVDNNAIYTDDKQYHKFDEEKGLTEL